MEKNQIIIIALIVIIIALLVGMVAVMPNFTKKDTNLDIKSKEKLNEGDSFKVKLTDVNGNIIAGQSVNITITDKNNTKSYYSVETNEKGEGSLKLDKQAGDYDITVTYSGNNDYKNCSATQKIKIEQAEEDTSSSDSSQSTSSPTPYAYKSDGTPMYSKAEADNYMLKKYGTDDYERQSNGYIDPDSVGRHY